MTSEDRIQIRISLEAARVNAELLQKDAAKLIGISLKTLQNYENGKTKPNWDTLIKMSDIYNIPIGMLNCRVLIFLRKTTV